MNHRPTMHTFRRPAGLALCGCLLGLSLLASAADKPRFPGAAAGARTVSIQQRVESLYAARDFQRALLIYEKQLAPIGDKYAQYMVGYMTLTGRGTAADPALALAWYQLAAERNARPYVLARDTLLARLTDEEVAQSQRHAGELRPQYGDRRLLLDLIEDDIGLLQSARSRSGQAALVTGFLGGQVVDHEALARERLAERLAYLDELPAVDSLREKERQLRERLAAVTD